jgi:hypothetical protein
MRENKYMAAGAKKYWSGSKFVKCELFVHSSVNSFTIRHIFFGTVVNREKIITELEGRHDKNLRLPLKTSLKPLSEPRLSPSTIRMKIFLYSYLLIIFIYILFLSVKKFH